MSNYGRVRSKMEYLRDRLKINFGITANTLEELRTQVNKIHLELAYAEREWIQIENMLKETEE